MTQCVITYVRLGASWDVNHPYSPFRSHTAYGPTSEDLCPSVSSSLKRGVQIPLAGDQVGGRVCAMCHRNGSVQAGGVTPLDGSVLTELKGRPAAGHQNLSRGPFPLPLQDS